MADMHQIADHRTVQRYETFSYLPQMDQNEVFRQINFLLAQGWTPAIEHEHPSRAFNHYWPMWKLPFFGENDPQAIVAEIEACHRAYPEHHIRLLGYDNYAQSQGTSFLVYRGRQGM